MLTARHLTPALALIVLSYYCAGAAAHELRIEHVTIVSPDRSAPLRDASIKVIDDRVTAIVHGSLPPDGSSKADIIDGRGLYVIPGLIDSHVHTSDPPGIDNSHEATREQIAEAIRKQTPRSYLFFGYTTLIDLISTPESITAWNTYEAHPDLYFCGGAEIPGGYPPIDPIHARTARRGGKSS
jgi:hypothetical protein